ncbi:MAG TPA: GAF domain-containing protein [Nocardioides sp.]|uniref:hybrid sensor histidine kinase/response regulator n=1 Tax=Nocardioides sp. TaxID=35761 RepID=UPI002E377227|nr:GAF domain-containing protein [Nocardioides sp.]HEX5087413.1 GAF domain-containing protein [Nocardioides sp.]
MVDPVETMGTVSAEEHERLRRSHTALQEQLDAVTEVLGAIGRSGGDPEAVLTTIVESARRLCRSDAVQLYTIEGGLYQLVKGLGLSDETIAYIADHPMPMNRDTMIGRVGLDRTAHQIPDVTVDSEYGRLDLQRIAGFRTTMGAPLILEDEVVGALGVWRNDVKPFDEREISIITAFAGQAAMAINGVKLVQELQRRRTELARKVDELEALRSVGETVSSTLDLDEVLATIATHAVELSGTDGGSIMEYDEQERRFLVRSVYRTSAEVVARLQDARIGIDATLVGRAAEERRPIAVPDLGAVALDPHLQVLFDDGWRSLVAVPMLREDRIVGSLIVRRRATGDFSEEVVDLLETFASQSALALLNAQLFRALEERSDQLEVASRHKSEFLASMSHELRTPLNAVLGFSEVLLERMFGEINEKQEDYLRDIHSSGKHLLELLNEILDLSKVEAGQMELEYAQVDVPAVLEYAASMLRERASAHSVELRVDVGAEVGAAELDELRFKQVVLNLVSNAVKFTPDGGRVVLRAREAGDELQVSVEDSGVGIPEADRERIFESFQQGGRGASREEGTGLGLTLSRRIVELLGGRMWLESEVGHGSTFGFAVPVRRARAEPSAAGPDGATSIVVIEDDRPSLDLLTAYLSGAAIRVVAARDGHAGLEAVRREQPSAVLLDIRMPGIDGWEVLGTLKDDPQTAHIPVVVVSIVDERSRGAELGAAGYLVKPVSRDDLVSALKAIGLPVAASVPVAGGQKS